MLGRSELRQFSRYSDGFNGRGSIPDRSKGLSSPQLSDWVPRFLSPGVKRPGREADHSPPSSAKVENSGTILPLLQTPSWRDDQLIKHSVILPFRMPKCKFVRELCSCPSPWNRSWKYPRLKNLFSDIVHNYIQFPFGNPISYPQ
jgi:hypothetical protein